MGKNTQVKRLPQIEANKETNKNFIKALYDIFSKNKPKEDIDKLKAAYALNMCTVSISQIIDYNDINILEQEYDAILNNLNLEQMPKDEALLRILKQILDTITYFRIEEGERKFIEKDYKNKMKNAIWSAVPKFGVIIASGNPITAAVSLASQVGTGYMNYRREKANCENEKEKQMWELRKTAIEQFNGLRRELFDTAWRLADEYEFSDNYRLTEKQISQYNKILMDNDEIRKHERLYSIRDKFVAYPPFWYYIGNTAKRISENTSDEVIKTDFAEKAREYFDNYFNLNKYNLLREDQLAATGLLEYAEILLKDTTPDREKITECIDKARAMCGNAFDVYQICAYLYLRNNDGEKASEVLRILVNEDYNRILNGQLLSSIYVKEHNEKDYKLLCTRVDEKYLYPMNKDDTLFKSNQGTITANKFAVCLSEFFNKYAIEWNKIIPVFDADKYPDSFFAYTSEAKEGRLCEAAKIFNDKDESYKNRLDYCNYEIKILDVINEVYNKLFSFDLFKENNLLSNSKEKILEKLRNVNKKYNELSEKIDNGTFDEEDYKISQSDELSIIYIFKDTIKLLSDHLIDKIRNIKIEEISKYDGLLSEFCSENGLDYPETTVNKQNANGLVENPNVFSLEVFGEEIQKKQREIKLSKDVADCIKKHINEESDVLFTNSSPKFNEYFDNKKFIKKSRKYNEDNYDLLKKYSIAIYKDNKFDLHLTIKGIFAVCKNEIFEGLWYSEVQTDSNRITLTKDSYEVKPSVVNIFRGIINDVKKIMSKDEGKAKYTKIDTLLWDLYHFDVKPQLTDLKFLRTASDLEFLRTASIEELEEKFKSYEANALIELANDDELARKDLVAANKLKVAVRLILDRRGYDNFWIGKAIPSN